MFPGGYCAKSPARPPLQHLSNFEHRPLRQTQEHYASGDAEADRVGKRKTVESEMNVVRHAA